MRCPRCLGWMMPEQVGDFEKFTLFACLNCGERVDHQILRNRQQPVAAAKQYGRWGRSG